MEFKNLLVMGLGYIGLPTAATFASHGLQVIGVDINQKVVDTINAGLIPIVEPQLDDLVQKMVAAQKLRATTQVAKADAFIIAVPTPFKEGYTPDLSYVKSAIKALAEVLEAGNLIILESTSPVGTTERVFGWLKELRPDIVNEIDIAYCPERVLPGKILYELIHNNRIIGGLTKHAADRAKQLYRMFVQGNCYLTDARTAEMSKLTENAFRDVNIAFANELSILCEKLNINVWELRSLANRHPRVNILEPGPGVGGHCIAVDPWFIVDAAPRDVKLIRAAREINDAMPSYIVEKIKIAAQKIPQPTICCLGLSYKANVDDVRESPAVEVMLRLASETDFRLIAVEPHIKELPQKLMATKRVALANLNDGLYIADIILILVDHDAFKHIVHQLERKTVIDTRGLLIKSASASSLVME
jgi:UDP-N-acetyl-D-mannosaminuronic acid dehydrogenase